MIAHFCPIFSINELVTAAFEYGFVSGNSEMTYNPDGNITLAETLVIADRIHSTYYGSEIESVSGGEW